MSTNTVSTATPKGQRRSLTAQTFTLLGTLKQLRMFAANMAAIGWKIKYNGHSGSWLAEPVYKITKAGPKVVSWPITRERYRQVLLKMHRQWEEIQNLQLEIERLKEELDMERK